TDFGFGGPLQGRTCGRLAWMMAADEETDAKVVAGNETPVLLQDLPSALPDLVDVVGFLDPYGYKARSPLEWSEWKAVPELTLEVCGHSKVDGHTVYDVKCALAAPGCW
ncbi:unnamed protein product, partial [Effrenium voratum]